MTKSYQLPEPTLPNPGGFQDLYTADQMQAAYAAGRDELVAAVRKVHAAKGRYHSQLTMCDLYDLCGLKNERPMK